MSYNTQNPYFWTLDGSATLEIVGATYIYIYNDPTGTSGDSTSIYNSVTAQGISLPLGCVMELSPDSGNTLQTIQILPNGLTPTYVTMIGGIGQLI